jgi:hypothetical protein
MIVEIVFIVLWILGLVFLWPGGPWATQGGTWGWAPHLYYMVLFGLLALAIFDGLRLGH